jgi:hypothetical protein
VPDLLLGLLIGLPVGVIVGMFILALGEMAGKGNR